MDEDALVTRLLAAIRQAGGSISGAHVRLGPGPDDAAIFSPPPGVELVWSCDAQLEGVHFERSWGAWAGWEAIGAKATGASLADLAAKGAEPLGALLTLNLPESLLPLLEDLGRGIGRKLAEGDCPLLGGNLSRSPAGLCISLSVLGSTPRGRALLRGDAQEGDLIFVGGALGRARLGLLWLQKGGDPLAPALRPALERLLDPQPPWEQGLALARSSLRAACLDLSDGLARDLPRLARASQLSAQVERGKLPGPEPRLAALVGQDPQELAWLGGEDYQLLVAGPPELGEAVSGLKPIGRMVRGQPGEVFLDGLPTSPQGFDHFASQTDP